MSKILFNKISLALALSIVSYTLSACSSAADQDAKDPFSFAASMLNSSDLYGPEESITVKGILPNHAQGSGDEISISYPSLFKQALPPDGVTVSEFRGGYFDESSALSMKESLGCAPNTDSTLPEGFSYVLVEETLTNNTDTPISYDVSQGIFIAVGESNAISFVGTNDPLWHSAWNGSDPKQYWIVNLDPKDTLDVQLLYVLPDDAIASNKLAYLVDPGNANGEEGFVGLKAFDVADHIQG